MATPLNFLPSMSLSRCDSNMEPLPASYYGELDQSNPVIFAFERDLKQFKSYMKRLLDSSNFDHFSYSRGSVKLFEIWKKYKPRLPSPYYEERLVKLADILYQSKFYRLALWQGYGLHLQHICTAGLDSIKNVDQLRQSFFPEGFHTEGAELTLHAMQRECMCSFYLERERRSNQPDPSTMQKLLGLLAFLRLMTQAILPHENLYRLLYNGTLCIYEIGRFLMSVGRSAQALDFLLWACVCLETFVPLLTPDVLPWRATLYCAVCECYYDEQAAVPAEVFARRALGKIRELEELVEMSDSPVSSETHQAFKEATIKLALMLFKRSVFEPRRKSKVVFKYKQKNNFREACNIAWPRSLTERILTELFVGNAAQFLAVLEALRDPSRRPLSTGLSDEAEIQEVELELMAAGISILSGNGGSSDRVYNDRLPPSLSAITATDTILELAVAGQNQVSVDAAVTFVKLLFRCEQWDMFGTLSDSFVTVLSKMEARPFQKAELELNLLRAAGRVLCTHRVQLGTRDIMTEAQPEKDKTVGLAPMTDELLDLVQTLHGSVCNTAQDVQPDEGLVLDIVLFLWAKLKLMFQRAQARHSDSVRYLGKMEYQDKWLQALSLLCEVAGACGLADVDLVAVAEMTLRLAVALETSIEAPPQTGTITASAEDHSPQSTYVERSWVHQLEMMCGVLERGLECVSRGRTVSLPCRTSAICDIVFMQKFGGARVHPSESEQPEGPNTSCVSSFFMDLHVELLTFYHRVSLKLLDASPDEETTEARRRSTVPSTQGRLSEAQSERATAELTLVEKIKKNKISKALFLAQKALLCYKKDTANTGTKKLLEEAAALMEKAEVEERRLAGAPAEVVSGVAEGCRPPPPPVLLSRTDRSMTFTPAPYSMEGKVCWYRIYGREVEGVSLKVRIGDCHLPGTGEMIPCRGECLLCVSGLEPNQKYIFAVASYDAEGNLLGNSIGDTTRPLLASLPLPLLTTWAHLAQVAYQTGQYAVAKKACSDLWSHFTFASSLDPGATQEPLDKKYHEGLAQTRLRWETLQLSSPLLQQRFLSSVFMQTDINIQERALYCDSLTDGSSFIWGQEARLAECERMLVAIDLALYLNDSSAALQATVTCYGLLAPIIYYQIPSDAVIQVLLKCLVVLHEILGALRQNRPADVTESLRHMVACITHYVAKGLRWSRQYRMASAVMEQGKELLQEMMESVQQPSSKPTSVQRDGVDILQKKASSAHKQELCVQLKALEAVVWKHRTMDVLLNYDGTPWNAAGSPGYDLSGQEDPVVLHMVIGCSSLTSAFRDVMKFKWRPHFLEFAVLLLEKALLMDQLLLLPQWGLEIFGWLNRRDEDLTVPKKPQTQPGKDLNNFTSSVIEYSAKKQKVGGVMREKKKRDLRKSSFSRLGAQISEEVKEILVKQLIPLVRRHRGRWRLRQITSEERPWRCRLNLALARAHLGLLRTCLRAWTGAHPQQCYSYSKMPLVSFSLARTGTLVKRKNIPQHIRTPPLSPLIHKPVLLKADDVSQGATDGGEDGGESEAEIQPDTPRTQMTNEPDGSDPSAPDIRATRHAASQPLDTLCKASVHLRRAMVLAHRGGHWTSLQWVCETLWDQFNTLAVLVEHIQGSDTSGLFTLDQYYTVFTPLLALASDLLMDMCEKLKLWDAFSDGDEEVETSLQRGGPPVDSRWLRTLVLLTLELLHHQAKWESLAHLALLYNCYTRERHAHAITPVLLHAQRKLLERISHWGGPPAPQPHFTHTETFSGEKVTCRNYAGRQLFLQPRSGVESWLRERERGTDPETLEMAEVKRAMCLVRVPLDIEDTLCCLRARRVEGSHAHHALQHSRTLMLLLLANTQCVEEPSYSESCSGGQRRVEFDPTAVTAPAVDHPDPSSGECGRVWTSPLAPSHTQAVLTSYGNSIKLLQANKSHSLLVQALHDRGNLHFYSGNQKAAHSHWTKALDCALLTTGVLESWDGQSWGGSSSQQPLRHAGIRGCLQGALLSAKIAQHILTESISQRTKCCLLSAKLFKCLLRASLPHPHDDLDYRSYSLKTDLVPGVELFSESDSAVTSNVVSCLGFLCHWLYTCGHHLTVLPLLALYQYVASTVCRDPYLTVGCRILKVRALTELSLFAEAVTELHSLTLGGDVPRSYNRGSGAAEDQGQKLFMNHKPLTDPCNLQVLEELVNRRPDGDVVSLYGPVLTHRLLLAKIQLISAICGTIHELPEALAPTTSWTSEVSESQETCSVIQEGFTASGLLNITTDQSPRSSPTTNSSRPKGLQLYPPGEELTLGQVKALLLREASVQLWPELLGLKNIHRDPEELELAVDTRLLLSNLSLQEGQTAGSADLATSALRLLQDSPLFQREIPPPGPEGPPASALRRSERGRLDCEQTQTDPSRGRRPWDVPVAVEALERMGRSYWLRCRLGAVHSLTAHIPGTALVPGLDSSAEADRLLKDGLAEAEAWGDPDTQALLLLLGVQLHSHCGRAPEESVTMLQEAVSLLSARSPLSRHSRLALAEATVLLGERRGSSGRPLDLLAQELLCQQLCAVGECIVLKAGGDLELPSNPGLMNIYHPQLPLLARATMRLGLCKALQAMENSSGESEGPWGSWLATQKVLERALTIAQASASRHHQLEADILYYQGKVGRVLTALTPLQHQGVVESFLKSIMINHSHTHNLQLIHKCYVEMALIYLEQWRMSTDGVAGAPPTATPAPIPTSSDKLSKNLTVGQSQLLLFWVCTRAATTTMEALTNCFQLRGFTGTTGVHIPLVSLKALPGFVSNDLLHPCGGTEEPVEFCPSWSADTDNGESRGQQRQLTWVHLSRYYTHLLNLRHICTQPAEQRVEGLLSLSGDPSLALRLDQLHAFFSQHLAGYREKCVTPDPPADLILETHVLQLSHTVKVSVCQPKQPLSDLYPWAAVDAPQLCIQWHRPTLVPGGPPPDTIVLVFAMNKAPLSAMRPSAVALADLEAGQRLVSLDRLKALHSQLISARVEADVDSLGSDTAAPSRTATLDSRRGSKSYEKPAHCGPHRQILLEKTRHICKEIRNLLKPDLKSPASEVPTEASAQTLGVLELCFNPATGGTVENRALSAWLISLLV